MSIVLNLVRTFPGLTITIISLVAILPMIVGMFDIINQILGAR